jgi:hypothetical protein
MAVPFNATGLWPSANFGDAPKYAGGTRGKVSMSAGDRGVLRGLAERVARNAARPSEAAKRELWYALNDLKSKRPLVLVDPENGWNEIVTLESLACSGELARRWEMVLRKELFWGDSINDDRPMEPLFEVGYTYADSEWGVEEDYHGGAAGESYTWEGKIQEPDDVAKIRMPVITIDEETTRQTLELARDVFGGILQVGQRGIWWWSLGMTLDLARLVGLEKMLYLMYDNPGMVHRIMGILRDGYLAKLDYLEKNGLLFLNNAHSYVGSGGIGYTRELPRRPVNGSVKAADMWCLTESQETVGVSPEQFEEFVFQYQLPIQQRFGLNCYGCCEPLQSRWHILKDIPRLRRVSVSPWADQEKMAEMLEDKYVYSRKPAPSLLAVPRVDEEAVRADIRATLDVTRGCVVELIMKDNHTLGRNPDNLVRWVRIVREEIARQAG